MVMTSFGRNFKYRGRKNRPAVALIVEIRWRLGKDLIFVTDLAQHTCLIGRHIEWHILLCMVFGQLWHPVDSLQQEAVVGVWLQVGHHHWGVCQADTAWQEAHIGAAFFQAPSVWKNSSAQDVVAHVLPAACFHGDRPLQEDACLVDIGDGIAWGRRRAWKRWRQLESHIIPKNKSTLVKTVKRCTTIKCHICKCPHVCRPYWEGQSQSCSIRPHNCKQWLPPASPYCGADTYCRPKTPAASGKTPLCTLKDKEEGGERTPAVFGVG